jgi:hypothetical protein
MSFERLRSSEKGTSCFHSTETDRCLSITNTASKNYAFSRLQSCSSVLACINKPRTHGIRLSCGSEPNMGIPLREGSNFDCARVGWLVGSEFLRPPSFLSRRSLHIGRINHSDSRTTACIYHLSPRAKNDPWMAGMKRLSRYRGLEMPQKGPSYQVESQCV